MAKAPYTFRPTDAAEKVIEDQRKFVHPERQHVDGKKKYWEVTEIVNACVMFCHEYGLETVLAGRHTTPSDSADEKAYTEIQPTTQAPIGAAELPPVLQEGDVRPHGGWAAASYRRQAPKPVRKKRWPVLLFALLITIGGTTTYYLLK